MNIPGRANIWTGRYKKTHSALLCYVVLFAFLLLNTNVTNQKGRLAKWCVFWQRIIGRCRCFVIVHLHQGEGRQNAFSGSRIAQEETNQGQPQRWASELLLRYCTAQRTEWNTCAARGEGGPPSSAMGKCMARCYSGGTEMLWTCFQLSPAHATCAAVHIGGGKFGQVSVLLLHDCCSNGKSLPMGQPQVQAWSAWDWDTQ